MNQDMLRLYDYHVWANHRIIGHLNGLPENLLHLEVRNVFPTVSHMLGHIYSVDTVWFARLENRPPELVQQIEFATVEEAADAFNELSTAGRRLLEGIDDVGRVVTYDNSKGDKFHNTVIEVVQHLVNHGTYHRGNIASAIREGGYFGVSTDFITFVRERAE